jgi:signal transduction histidine kinase
VSAGYLLLEFAIGMRINALVQDGLVPLILLPLAAQAVLLLPRIWAGLFCALVVAGVSGNLTWIPTWPLWFRNLATATAAVVFVVVYVGVAVREREARERVEKLSEEVASLAAANERNRLAREIHDTLGHYLTVIHVQLEAARALIPGDPERGLLAINRAQTLAKDGLTAVRQSVRSLRDDSQVQAIPDQLASLAASLRDETFDATFTVTGTPRPVGAAVALALHRAALEALTNVRRHASATQVELVLAFAKRDRVGLVVRDNGQGAAVLDGGFGLMGIRERAQQIGGTVDFRTAPGGGFTLEMELPG